MDKQVEGAVVAEPEFPSSYGQLRLFLDVLLAPSRAFMALRKRPTWLWAFVASAVVLVAFHAATGEQRLNDMKTALRANPRLSAEEVNRRVQNIEAEQQRGFSNVSVPKLALGVIAVAAKQGLQLFSLAFVLWLVLQLFASHANYKTVLSVCSFSYLVVIPEALIKIPLVVAKGTMNIQFGLAAFLPPTAQGTPVYSALQELNVFSGWMVALLAIALPIITPISSRRAILTMGLLWACWIVILGIFGNLVQIG